MIWACLLTTRTTTFCWALDDQFSSPCSRRPISADALRHDQSLPTHTFAEWKRRDEMWAITGVRSTRHLRVDALLWGYHLNHLYNYYYYFYYCMILVRSVMPTSGSPVRLSIRFVIPLSRRTAWPTGTLSRSHHSEITQGTVDPVIGYRLSRCHCGYYNLNDVCWRSIARNSPIPRARQWWAPAEHNGRAYWS